jgi:putative multicomponent Na+:H+ antiporter subunit B
LLPLAALTLVLQVNPYQDLVIRAILGAIAALVYAVFGAADVALTEALVGTMLAITLYVIAVRSSLVMRLGVLASHNETDDYFQELITKIQKVIYQYHLRLEIVEYPDLETLDQALQAREIHASCRSCQEEDCFCSDRATVVDVKQRYHTTVRVQRLFEIMKEELAFPDTTVTYQAVVNEEEKH